MWKCCLSQCATKTHPDPPKPTNTTHTGPITKEGLNHTQAPRMTGPPRPPAPRQNFSPQRLPLTHTDHLRILQPLLHGPLRALPSLQTSQPPSATSPTVTHPTRPSPHQDRRLTLQAVPQDLHLHIHIHSDSSSKTPIITPKWPRSASINEIRGRSPAPLPQDPPFLTIAGSSSLGPKPQPRSARHRRFPPVSQH